MLKCSFFEATTLDFQKQIIINNYTLPAIKSWTLKLLYFKTVKTLEQVYASVHN